MKINEVNKHNIKISLLQKLKVAKKDYNKVTEIKYDSNLNIQIPVYAYVQPSYIFKQTIRPFTKNKGYKTSFAPTDAKISSIYQSYQNAYRTKNVDNHISAYKRDDKKLES